MLKGFKNYFSVYNGLSKSIYVLFFARLINSMGNFVYPLLTLLLTGKLGFTPKMAGDFVSFAAVSYVPGALLGGRLCDYFGRKKVLIFSQLFAAFCFISCAFLGKSMLIPILLILSGVFNGAAQPASNAMVTDLTKPNERQAAFSMLYLGSNIGFAVGPLIAGFLYRNYMQWIFLGNAIFIFLAVSLVFIFVEETLPSKVKKNIEALGEYERAEEGNVFKVLLKRPVLMIYAFLSVFYNFAYIQGNFTTTLLLQQIYHEDASKLFGILNSVNGIIVITMTTFIIHLTSKYEPMFNIFLAGLFFAVGFGMQYFISSFVLFVLSTIIWTIGEVLNATSSGVYVANRSPISHRGRFNSVIFLISGSGMALGPLFMGRFINKYGVRSAWILVFFITLIASFGMFLLYLFEKKKTECRTKQAV